VFIIEIAKTVRYGGGKYALKDIALSSAGLLLFPEKTHNINHLFVRLGKQATTEKKYVIRKLGSLAEPELETVKSILRRIFKL
jgi:hypothetical protein